MITRRTMTLAMAASVIDTAYADQSSFVFVIPSSPGGSSDTSGRFLAQYLTESGLRISVTNRSAGQGVEGTMHVVRSQPNSGNLLIGGPNGLFFSTARNNMPYTSDSVEPICMFSTAAFVIAAKRGSFPDIASLLNAARTRDISVGVSQTDGRYLIDTLGKSTSTKLTPVMYRGGGDVARDLQAGVLNVAMVSLASILGLVQSGDVILLAHTSDEGRVQAYPELPHLATWLQNDNPALSTYHWHGLYAPIGIPNHISETLQNAVQQTCLNTRFINEHTIRGMTVRFMNSGNLKSHHLRMTNYMSGYSNWLRENE